MAMAYMTSGNYKQTHTHRLDPK